MEHDSLEWAPNGTPAQLPTFEDAYPVIRRVAGIRAATLVRNWGIPADERDDLAQEATLSLWRKIDLFDPSRSSLKTFVERVVASEMTSFIRRRQAAKRRARPERLAADGYQPDVDRVHLRLDVSRVLRRLPRPQREIGLMLAQYSPSEVSRRAGISRASVYRIIVRLRIEFTQAGLNPGELRRTRHG